MVEGIASYSFIVVHLHAAGPGQILVVPDAVFGGAGADAAEGQAEPRGVGEGAAVDGDTEDEFVGGDAGGEVIAHGAGGGEGGAGRVVGAGVEVCLVAGTVGEGAGIVVGH